MGPSFIRPCPAIISFSLELSPPTPYFLERKKSIREMLTLVEVQLMGKINRSPALIHALLMIAAILVGGCAISNPDNRRTMNKLDEWVQPESTTARVALAPVAIPVGTAAGVTDMLIVHPVCVIPDAADDVYELYWKPREMDAFRKTLLIPFCVILTPPTFVVDWLFRSIFDVGD